MAETVRSALDGKRIVITRAAAQSEALSREFTGHGAISIVLPLVSFAEPEDFAPMDKAIVQLERFDWMILTSAQAVRAVVARSKNLGRPLIGTESKVRIAAVGPVTAQAAKHAGLPVEYVANIHNSVALSDELGERLRERKVFLPRSDRATPDMPVALRRHGAHVTEAIAYRTLRPSEIDKSNLSRIAAGEADAVLFFSPTAVQHFEELLGRRRLSTLEHRLAITAAGPVTARALREAGVGRMVVAADTTTQAVVETLEKYFAGTIQKSSAGAKRG